MNNRRIKRLQIACNLDMHVRGLILILNELPSDCTFTGASLDYSSNCSNLFFESSLFKEVTLGSEVPTFTPIFRKEADGSIILVDSGLELWEREL